MFEHTVHRIFIFILCVYIYCALYIILNKNIKGVSVPNVK